MAQRLNAPDQSGTFHFVTLNVRDRKTPFARPEYAKMLLHLLRFECDRHPATLAAYVAMPDHLHFLFGPQDGQVTRFLARFKPNATRNLDAIAREKGRVRDCEWLVAKGHRELWQDGKHSTSIYSPEWIRQKVEYIHNNPIKRGLVENAGEFLYSSFGAYFPASGHVPLVDVDLAELYSLPGFNTPQLAAKRRKNRDTVRDELPLAQEPQCDNPGLPSGVSGEISSYSF